jgi:16S rRNA (cytidine1402-2'-O)-methyltransferase
VPVPGASAALSALAASGMHTERFVFEGFLPVKKRRRTRLEQIASEERTVILYESVHRIVRTLEDLREHAGNRRICVAREITKLHEEIFRGTLEDAIDRFSSKQPKGEFTIVLQGAGAFQKA